MLSRVSPAPIPVASARLSTRFFALAALCSVAACVDAPLGPGAEQPPKDPTLPVMGLWVDPNSQAAAQVQSWAQSRPADAAQLRKISENAQANWLVRADPFERTRAIVDAAAANTTMPVFVAYYIPNRDCGGFSSGGAPSASAYRTFIDRIASAIGSRRAMVILEPDALAALDCVVGSARSERVSLLLGAVRTLSANANTFVYLDAGHPSWRPPSVMAPRLRDAGVAEAAGFAVNVANTHATAVAEEYGRALSSATDGARFVIDTSRNGRGAAPPDQWCNPSGRGLGPKPEIVRSSSGLDAYLWIKRPGESDGTCNGGPTAGVWWAQYALGLATRSSFASPSVILAAASLAAASARP